jgi:hypothetical protein
MLRAGLVHGAAGFFVLTRSSVGPLAITDAAPSGWLLVVGVVQRRVDPIAVLSATTVMIALAAYALTGRDPLAIKLRWAAATGNRHMAHSDSR